MEINCLTPQVGLAGASRPEECTSPNWAGRKSATALVEADASARGRSRQIALNGVVQSNGAPKEDAFNDRDNE